MKHFKTIGEFHRFRQLPEPQHPHISVIDVETVMHFDEEPESIVLDFYSISVKRMHNVKVKYGGQPFDFNNGSMSFLSPGQVISISVDKKDEAVKKSGWVIYIHPDFLWNTTLAKNIRKYDFWDYSLNEALFLLPKEETTMKTIQQNILDELNANIDRFSKRIIVTHIESLLNYAERFYNRQFITHEKTGHEVLVRLEALLNTYFNGNDSLNKGLPTVQYVAEQLHLSPKYLSSLLRTLTGQNTQQHIHEKLIEKAKEKLSTTNLTVSEIAYELGFDHLQSFSRLFKVKTKQSPLEFRASFN